VEENGRADPSKQRESLLRGSTRAEEGAQSTSTLSPCRKLALVLPPTKEIQEMGVRGKILAAGEVNLGFRAELVLDSREPAYVSSLKAALRIMEFIRGEGTSISLTKSATLQSCARSEDTKDQPTRRPQGIS